MEVAPRIAREQTVSLRSSLDFKERVRQAIDIVELIGSFVTLRRQGRNFVGLCPWHDDTRPSLQVSPDRQSYRCWVCNLGGDVFSFMMQIEGVAFPEALATLAERAGIAPDPPAGRSRAGRRAAEGFRDEAKPGRGRDKRHLFAAAAWAENQFHACLLRDEVAAPARRYLAERGITPDSTTGFRLGFAPVRRDWLLERCRGTPFDAQTLEAIGLIVRRESGGYYDRFAGRVLFPIRDTQGRTLGFGGRILPEAGGASKAKYLNSPETPLFAKSHLLYGLDAARDSLRRSNTALVMEGYTDCIMAHQHGFTDAVAVLGTALGPEHVRLLRRFADRIVLVLDGDEAGRRRANEVLELFIAQQVELRVLTLPAGLDPCDYLQDRGAAAFAALLESHAEDAMEHAFRAATEGIDLARDVHRASEALERLVAILAKAPRDAATTPFRQEKIIQRLAERFRVPEGEVRARLASLRGRSLRRATKPETAPAPAQPHPSEPADAWLARWQDEVLQILIVHPELVPKVTARLPAGEWPEGPRRRIFAALDALLEEGTTPSFERLMLCFDDPQMKCRIVALDEAGRGRADPAAEPARLLDELMKSYFRRGEDRRRGEHSAALRSPGLDPARGAALLEEILLRERTRHGISEPKEG